MDDDCVQAADTLTKHKRETAFPFNQGHSQSY